MISTRDFKTKSPKTTSSSGRGKPRLAKSCGIMRVYKVEGRQVTLFEPNETIPSSVIRVIDNSGQTICYVSIASNDDPATQENHMRQAVQRHMRLKAQNITNPKIVSGKPILLTPEVLARMQTKRNPRRWFYIPLLSAALGFFD